MWGINPPFLPHPVIFQLEFFNRWPIVTKARPEYSFLEAENGAWNRHVFDYLGSPAQSPRHNTVQSGDRKFLTSARLDRNLSLRG